MLGFQRPPHRTSPEQEITPLEVLGLSPAVTHEEIKSRYRALARQHHPDAGGDPERFREITEAYEALQAPKPPELDNKTLSRLSDLRRDLNQVIFQQGIVEARVATFAAEDYRIELMRGPLREKKAELEAEVRRLMQQPAEA